MKRFVVALIAGAAVFAMAFAAAATVSVNGGTIQAGADTDVTCTGQANVAGWGLETNDGTVHFVRINYNSLCAGNDMFVVVTHNGTKIASADTKPTHLDASGQVKLDFAAPYPLAIDITDLEVFIEGPGGTPDD